MLAVVDCFAGGRADAPKEGVCGPRRWRELAAGHSDKKLFLVRRVQDLLSRGYLDFPGVPQVFERLFRQDIRARWRNTQGPFEVDGLAVFAKLGEAGLHGCTGVILGCSS